MCKMYTALAFLLLNFLWMYNNCTSTTQNAEAREVATSEYLEKIAPRGQVKTNGGHSITSVFQLPTTNLE